MIKVIKTCILSILFASIAQPFITSTGYEDSRILFAAILFAVCVRYFFKSSILVIVLQTLACITLLYFYTNNSYASFGVWFQSFGKEAIDNASSFFRGVTPLLPQELGLLLIYFSIAVAINLIYIHKNLWPVIVLSYLIYILTLSAFLKIQYEQTIVKIVAIAIIYYLIDRFGDFKEWRKLTLWTVVCFVLVTSATHDITIYKEFRSKVVVLSEPIRNALTRRNFYDFFNLNNSNSSNAQTGYSKDDTQLGGPLTQNHDIVFEVQEDQQTYWRVSTQYHYTGKGWDTWNNLESTESFLLPETVGKETLNPSEETLHTIISSRVSMYYLPIPLGKSSLLAPKLGVRVQSNTLLSYLDVDAIYADSLVVNGLKGMQYQTSSPISNPEKLKDVTLSSTSIKFVESLDTRYITPKIKALANQITEDYDTMYEKLVAIENYLKKSNVLEYSLSNVPYLNQDADFVEQFLFESYLGYCEHFATTMVVMAQSLGFPARYAKGFSKGSHNNGITTIRNSDAHVWPEVYFEKYGWIPFEPTPSFNLPLDIQNEGPQDPNNSEDSPTTPSNPGSTNEVINPETPQNEPSQKEISFDPLTILIPCIIIVLMFLIKYRFKIRIAIDKYRLNNKHIKFVAAFKILHRSLTRTIPKNPSSSLEEYAQILPKDLKLPFSHLIQEYQSIVFGNQSDHYLVEQQRSAMIECMEMIYQIHKRDQ